jgi:hypothetical protein
MRGWYNRPIVADVPSGLSLTPPRETKKKLEAVIVSRVQVRQPGNQFRVGATDFSFFRNVQTGAGAHPASHRIHARSFLFLDIKREGRKADHSPKFRAERKNAWSYTAISPYVPMA